MKLTELAARLGCRLEGDGDIEITRVAGIETAGPSDVTFFANTKYAAELRATQAGAVILGSLPGAGPPPPRRRRQGAWTRPPAAAISGRRRRE